MQVRDGDNFNIDPDVVLNTWKQDFEVLYNPPDSGESEG